MTGQERKQKILDILEESKTASVSMLAEEFKVSDKTIRRDLTALEEKGLLIRTRGGAMTPEALLEGSQMELELPVESSEGTSKEKDSKSATIKESVSTSEQVHPGVVVKTSRPEWIVRAIEKARPGTIIEPTDPVEEKEEALPVQEKKDEPTTKAPESASEGAEPLSTDEIKEPKKVSKEINVIEVGESITPEVIEGLIEYVKPKPQEESVPSSEGEKQEKPQEQTKKKRTEDKSRKDKQKRDKTVEDKPRKDKQKRDKTIEDKPREDKQKRDKTVEDKPREDKPRKDKPTEDNSKEERPVKDKPQKDKPQKDNSKEEKSKKIKSTSSEGAQSREKLESEERPAKQPPKEQAKKSVKSPESAKAEKTEESKRQKKPSKKAKDDRHKKANNQEGTVKSIRKNQKQKAEEPKESSKVRSVFDIIHIILAVICFVGGTILAIYILQTNRNQNVEIPEDNGRYEMMIYEDVSVNPSTQGHILVSVSDDTVIRVDF